MPVFQKAFILLKVSPGHEKDVVDDLMKISEVQEAHIVPGEWDVIAVISSQKQIVVPSDQRVYDLVLEKIVKIKHVQDTNTLVSQFSKSR